MKKKSSKKELLRKNNRREEHKPKRGVMKGMKEAYSRNLHNRQKDELLKNQERRRMVAKKKKQLRIHAGYEPQGELVDENTFKQNQEESYMDRDKKPID